MTKPVYVTNRGMTFTARYSNQDIKFPTNEEVEITDIVARHLFGYGEDDKEPYFVRLGWMKMNTDFEKAMSRLSVPVRRVLGPCGVFGDREGGD